MHTLRIICVEIDFAAAAHVGGPTIVSRKTFDVPCPALLAAWLAEVKENKFVNRSIEGVEPISEIGNGQ